MNKIFLAKMRAQLLAHKTAILERASQQHEIDSDGDETDEVQANFLIGLQSQLSGRDLNKLIQINAAIQKIKNGTFGICEDCEKDISEKRLNINPYFETCITCAEARELQEKREKRV
jgi:DnaK suppressor protein